MQSVPCVTPVPPYSNVDLQYFFRAEGGWVKCISNIGHWGRGGCEDELHDDVGVDGLVFVLAIFIPPTVRDSSLCRAMLLDLPLQCMTACVLKCAPPQSRWVVGGWAGVAGWAGLGWAGLGWSGLVWAGLGGWVDGVWWVVGRVVGRVGGWAHGSCD